MKCAIVIAGEIKQLMLTPETDGEKGIIKQLSAEDKVSIRRRLGSFSDKDGIVGFNVDLCRGDYLRAFSDTESLMLVFEPPPVEQPERPE